MTSWDQIKAKLEEELSKESYQNWFEGTSEERVEADTIWVRVPSEEVREWLEAEYIDQIQRVMKGLRLPQRRVAFSTGSGLETEARSIRREEGDFHFEPPGSQLNPRFRFDNFVVGPSNQLAHAAAKAVATNPSRAYNPLYIYGGVGMGKTHLMHAIGRHLMETYPGLRVVYTSSERFMNEMIACIRLGRMSLFHQHYRSADILLVDDIQVLGKKERTQDEFFHTFNELYDHQKQIVISSDCSPKDISGLVERLRSRFEWGLMADIQPPDLETKMAILDKKAEAEGWNLPEDVRIFLAAHTKSNVRELEGALVSLIAHASLTGAEITVSMAKEVLKHLVVNGQKRVTIDAIIRGVAEHFGLQPSQLKQRSNARLVAFPRQVAMYLSKELTPASLPEIGRAFGGKHHTTVLHSIQKIEQLRQRDTELNRTIHKLIDSLQ